MHRHPSVLQSGEFVEQKVLKKEISIRDMENFDIAE
jgi:hypothetical protein